MDRGPRGRPGTHVHGAADAGKRPRGAGDAGAVRVGAGRRSRGGAGVLVCPGQVSAAASRGEEAAEGALRGRTAAAAAATEFIVVGGEEMDGEVEKEEESGGSGKARFVARIGGKEAAFVEVKRVDESTVDCSRTVTLEEFRGQGIAERVVAHVFEWARRNGKRIIPSCSYIATRFLEKHPEFKEVVYSAPSSL